MTSALPLGGTSNVEARSLQKRTNVLADAGGDLDVEAGFRRNFEGLAGGVIGHGCHGRLAIELHPASPSHDLHPLGFVGAEMKLARVDEAERFLAAVGEENRVAD